MFPLLSVVLTAVLVACTAEPTPVHADPVTVPYTGTHSPLATVSEFGRTWQRGIIHVHSPFSHDACDGEGMPDGIVNEDCLQSQREALCATAMDYAFMTDHPSEAAYQPYEDLLLPRDDDEQLPFGKRMTCDDGHVVTLMPGSEDELMPVGLKARLSDDDATNDDLLNAYDATTFTAMINAGATILQAHTEGRDLDTLLERQTLGLAGTEIFNLHAMIDPNKREEDLGLEPYDYLEAISPFVTGTTDAEPDFAFLAFYQQQDVSLERWDALNAVAPMIGTAGTDAHENAIPSLLSDDERADSYRRMMIWFDNVLLTEGTEPEDYQDALAAGRLMVAFEILGEPGAWDVRYGALEMGGTAALGDELIVGCPTLSATSPRMGEEPEITVAVYKDGALFAEGCGSWTIAEPGVYRAVATITPHHLAGFLDDQTTLITPMPWLYSNALRIGL